MAKMLISENFFHRDTTLSASQDPSVWRHLGLIFLKRLLTPPAREWNRGVPQSVSKLTRLGS